jgi:predicted acetyltransferase
MTGGVLLGALWRDSRPTNRLEVTPTSKGRELAYLEVVADADNIASQRVIEANGGKLIERFHKSAEYGGTESLRFHIFLAEAAV